MKKSHSLFKVSSFIVYIQTYEYFSKMNYKAHIHLLSAFYSRHIQMAFLTISGYYTGHYKKIYAPTEIAEA